MAQALVALAGLISTAAADIDAVCKEKGVEFPSLDDPFDPAPEIQRDPRILNAAAVLAAAAEQIIAAAWPPAILVFQAATGFAVSAAMHVATVCNVSEALREAGPNGAHVSEICKGLPIPPQRLSRLLRLLATRHIFREVAPDVFCNNRLSSLLDTGKPLAVVREDPRERFRNTTGLVAMFEHSMDEEFKTASYLAEALMDPKTAGSDKLNETAFNLARRTDLDYWAWLERPDNAAILERFGMAMSGVRQLMPDEEILQGFRWAELPPSATIVDVGGGVGSVSLVIAKGFPQMNFVVQDRGKTIEDAHEYWTTKLPEAVSSGRVVFEEHNFFAEQPRRAPDVFLMRAILHDWADPSARTILQRLRDAAGTNTTLVVVEQLVPYACKVPPSATDVPGAETPPVPAPLLPNLGLVSMHGYFTDLWMMGLLNGQERTLPEFGALLESAGWRLERVHRSPGPTMVQLVAKPM